MKMTLKLALVAAAMTGFNPVHKTKVGDPASIAEVVLTLFKGDAEFTAGTNLVVDNDAVFDAVELTKTVDTPGPWAEVSRSALRSVAGGAYTGEIVAPPSAESA